jgi:hypothetical protein
MFCRTSSAASANAAAGSTDRVRSRFGGRLLGERQTGAERSAKGGKLSRENRTAEKKTELSSWIEDNR